MIYRTQALTKNNAFLKCFVFAKRREILFKTKQQKKSFINCITKIFFLIYNSKIKFKTFMKTMILKLRVNKFIEIEIVTH